ncbi:hypothetical protein ACJ41O_003307 [Fusarium nematophilum]
MHLTHALVLSSAASAIAVDYYYTGPWRRIPELMPGVFECNADEISTMNVRSCRCKLFTDNCPAKDFDACGHTATKTVNKCCKGCGDDNSDCKGCGLWFTSLCRCLKRGNGGCPSSGNIAKDGQPVWVHLQEDDDDDLIIPTKIIPGILEMAEQKNWELGNDGWQYAQQVYDPKTEALALNSWRARTHEQIHIHVCDVNMTTRAILDKEEHPKGGRLTQLKGDPEMWCIVREQKGTVNTFASTISEFLKTKHQGVCDKLVGAGIMRDTLENTWACATTSSSGPLGKFCG